MNTESSTDEIRDKGYCVLKGQLPQPLVENCRDAFWPVLVDYLETHAHEPNRGPHRHFLPMPFEPPCFAPEFFFDPGVLAIMRALMERRIVADQWGCDVPLCGSIHQEPHVDYRHPLFLEMPDLPVPIYMLVVSFGMVPIGLEHGPIEIAPGTHRMPREEALHAVQSGSIRLEPVPLEVGDLLIRHPWALHRGTPNTTGTPRALVTIRYVRRWYIDDSRDVNPIPRALWDAFTPEQKKLMRFPLGQ